MTPRPAKQADAVGGGRRHSKGGDGLGRGVVDPDIIKASPQQTVLIFSNDASLCDLVGRVAGKAWKLERYDDLHKCRNQLVRSQVGLVILDDEALEEQSRGWFLDRLRTYAPRTALLYVAGDHSDISEKRARRYAAFYTSKPLDSASLQRVLESFLNHAQGFVKK